MALLTSNEIYLHVNIFYFFSGHQCPESSPCEHSQGGSPEFTWSIVAPGDQREERNEKSHKKPDSPHGWEEGKNQGTHILLLQGNLNLNQCPLNHGEGILSHFLNNLFPICSFRNDGRITFKQAAAENCAPTSMILTKNT